MDRMSFISFEGRYGFFEPDLVLVWLQKSTEVFLIQTQGAIRNGDSQY